VTQENLKQHPFVIENLLSVETRKVIIPVDMFLYKTASLADALYFEKLFILAKKATSDRFLEPDLSRLSKLSARLKEPQDQFIGV